MKNESNGKTSQAIEKVATFIVDRRNLFFLLTILALIFCFFSRNWVEVENALTYYLPEDSKTKQALNVMEDEFITYGTASCMVANITYADADALAEQLKDVKGVQSVSFDHTAEHYNDASALFSITFAYDEDDPACEEALARVKEALAGYDLFVSTEVGDAQRESLDHEIRIIMIFVAIIVVSVLLFTSRTFGEVPVLVMTFVIAMVLNLGTNFLFGRISFIANSVTSILQLALSLDYAIILCNHFKEEHQLLPIREAAIAALSKAIPEIFASSLTTIGGLVALIFMNFRIGADMGRCLIKAILFAILTVFTVMPGLLVLFGNVIDKTVHRDLVPKIPFVGRFAYATRHVIPIVFVLLVAAAYLISSKLPYAYGYSTLPTVRLNETKYAQKLIEETFDTQNNLALIVPSGDYKTEAALLAELEAYPEIESAMGLANIEAMDGYMLADALSPREFAELADLDYETAQLVYAAYAAEHEEYGRLAGQIASYRVPLIDMFLFVCDELDAGVVSLDTDTTARLQDAQVQMLIAKRQLQGEQYSRMLLDLDLPVSADETFDFLDVIEQIAEKYYPDASVYMAGNSTNGYDFKKSFARDNTVVGVLSILIVLGVLLLTFQSAGMPLLLILVIQGAIWINFSIPALKNDVVFFMTYLIISSLQMGSNIDYAIVIASRYQEIKYKMSHRDAIIETMNFAFPTIITSGTIMILSGILVGYMTSDAIISGIGQSLARGTTVSVLLVMFVLPQILLLGGGIIDKTSFSVPNTLTQHTAGSGRVFIDGKVRGEVHGTVNGFFHGAIYGDTDLTVLSGANASASEEQEENRHEA